MGRVANEIDKWGWMVLNDSEGAPETKVKINEQNQGSRSYFESWGGRGGADKWLKEWRGGRAENTFSQQLFIIFKTAPLPLPLRGPWELSTFHAL